jgi:UDP-glucose 4-epimerase
MERAVIFGGLDFVGYHLCSYLVNEGIESIVVDQGEPSKLQMERYDTIGRNALLIRSNIEHLDAVETSITEQIDTIYFVYKPYNNTAYESKFLIKELQKALKLSQIKKAKLILLTSIITTNTRSPDCEIDTISHKLEQYLFKQSDSIKGNYKIVRAPYIYGTWCEDDCIIQQLITSKLQKQKTNLHPEHSTYLYVNDLIEFLYNVGVHEKDEKVFLYLSNEQNQVSKIYDWVGMNESRVETSEIQGDKDNTIIKGSSCTDIIEGLKITESYIKQKLKFQLDCEK